MLTEAKRNLLLTSSRYLDQKEYWINKLSGGLPDTKLLSDHIKRSRSTHLDSHPGSQLTRADIHITADLYPALTALSKNTDLSLYLILLAVLESLIYHYTGSEDMIVRSPLYKMNISEATLNRYLFIRLRDTGQLTFKELLIGTRQTVFEAYENQDYPIENLIDFLYNPGQSRDTGPCSHVECLLQNIHHYTEEGCTDIKDRLVFSFLREESRISGFILYNPDIYDEFYLRQVSEHFVAVLGCVLADVNVKVQGISFLSPWEKQQLVHDFNNTATQYVKDKLLCRRFEEQVSRTPGGTASVFEDFHLSYRRLNRESDHLGSLLQKKGVKQGDIVGIIAGRSIEMVVGIWGILKAGAAYLPIDPDYPGNRIRFMLEDSCVRVLVAQRALVEKLSFDNEIIYLEDCSAPAAGRIQPPALNVSPSSLAYVLYTSGSTGKPKGVMIEQQNVINLIDWFGRTFSLGTDTIVLQLTNYHFDPSVEDIFGTLLYGGTLHVANEDLVSDRERFRQYVKSRQVSIINYIPTYLKEFMTDEMDGEKNGRLESLRVIISGGEPLDAPLKDRLLNNGYRLYNNYGPTELTTDALSGECTLAGPVTLGKPIANCRAYILGKKDRLLPVGVMGELYISGAGVARGYLNNPGLTHEKFTQHPFIKGERGYRTGDFAGWLPDGTIRFIGRSDRQVKIRGYRVELGEIENRLLAHEEIKAAVVTCDGEDKYTCAYFVADREFQVAELRDFMSRELPDHMIPSYFMQVERIPLDPNGKIDRKALPAPRLAIQEDYEAPRDEIEEKLVKIWSEVLGIDIDSPGASTAIGINSNFFYLGGHSLKATILAAKIHKEFDVKLQLAQIFETPTVRELAGFMRTVPEKDRYAGIEPVEEKECYPLSSAQKRMYILQQMEPGNIAYNIPGIFQLEGAPDRDRLEATFGMLIRRHESLRTSFQLHNGIPVQRIHREVGIEIEYFNVSRDDVNIDSIIKGFIRFFDLSKAPLMRVGFIQWSSGNKYILMVDMHHIISDGISGDILARDFATLYPGEKLPGIKLQYKDYTEWQNREDRQEALRGQREYWIKQLEGEIPVLNFPTDYERPESHTFEGGTVRRVLGKTDSDALNKLALQGGATMYMVMLSIFYILLFKITRQEDIIVGTPVAGRGHADLEPVIGMFVNALALRNYPKGEKTAAQFLSEVKERTITAFENQDYPFDDLVETVVLNRNMGQNPFFDVMFDFQHAALDADLIPEEIVPGLKIKQYQYDGKTSKVDFIFVACEMDGRVSLSIEYCTGLYKRKTMEALLMHYEKIAGIVAADKDIKIRNIELIAGEKSELIRSEIREGLEEIETAENMDFAI